MLGAAVLIGLVTAVAAPALVLMGDDADDEDLQESEDQDVVEDQVTSGDVLDFATEAAETPGAIYEVDIGDGHLTLADFQPGQDFLSLEIPSMDVEIAQVDGSDGGVGISYGEDGAFVSVLFPHLEELPLEDMEGVVVDDETGDEVSIPFEALIEEDVLLPEPLAPVVESDSGAGEAVGDPIEPSGDGGDLGEGEVAYAPVLGPGTEDVPEGADGTLDVDEPEDQGDGEPTDHVILANTDGTLTEVIGFEPGLDTLTIAVPSAEFGEWETTHVLPSENGADAIVEMNGVPIALLLGAVEANLGDVEVVVEPELFS